MLTKQYSNLLLDQSNDLIWMVDAELLLTYANQAYLTVMKQVTGIEKKLQEPVLVEGFGDGYIEKWTGYYKRALSGEQFELEEHYSQSETNEIKFGQIIFNPIRDENQRVIAVACQSRDITRIVNQRSDAHQLMDASLDVFCTINEAGNFVFVSEASTKHWGYTPREIIGKPYVSFVIEDDISKTNHISDAILSGEEIKSFVNRYKRKDGAIAYNQWSARWDSEAKLMYCVARDAKEKIEQDTLLHESEQRFKALVQHGGDMISIIDVEGRYKYTSPTTTGILGITPEEFQGRTVFDFIHPDDIERAAGYMQRISTESKVIVEPFRLRDGNNEWRWIETVLTNMLDNPVVGGIVANSRDITENVNMLNDIVANEQFNKTVIENSPDCLKILDKDGGLLYMNFNGLYHMEIDDFSKFKHKKWWLLWGPENEELVREAVDKALSGETFHFTAFCPTAKGTPKWWDVSVSPVSIPGQPIQKIISVSRDITLQKEEEHRLKLLESVITNANDAVLITEAEPFDEPGPRILYVNEAFTKMTGYTAEEVIGKSPRILQGPKSDMAELARLGRALRNWEPCEITTINYKKNGEEFWINLSVSPVADKNGWYTHWISIERDVTEQKLKERERELLTEIGLNFNRENDYNIACKGLCQTIGVFGNFDWVELWTVNIDRSKVQYTGHYMKEPSNELFYTETKGCDSFEKGSGLPGNIWQKKNQVLWSELEDTKDFVRKEAAKKINLKTILGIPLINQNEVIGVLLVGSKQGANSLKKHARLFSNFHEFIGLEINRKKLETDLHHLYHSIPDIVCVTDFQGQFLKMNPSGCHLLGYTEQEILYHSFDEFVFPADKDIYAQELSNLGKGESVFSFENRYVKKNGEICWLSWTCNVNLQEGIIYATARNITAEKKLRELNNVTSKMARIGSWEVDLQKDKVFWSEMVHQLHETDPQNYEPDITEGINFYREDFRYMVTEAVNQCIQSGTPFDFEAVLVTTNKSELWVRVMGNAELLKGECIRIYGSFQDINERKEADLRLLSLADNLPGVVFQFQLFPDGTSKFLNLSKGVGKLYGIDAELILKNNALLWDQVEAGGDIDKVQTSIGESLATLTNWHVIYRNKLPNGKIIWLEGWGTPRRLPDGSTIWDSIVLEITNLKETEQLLDSASKLARVGSWEIVLQDNAEFKVFWSSMTKNILEIDESFEPTIANGINFYKEPSRSLMEAAMNKAIETGEAFDLELELITGKGNDIWIRSIGDAQFENGKVTRIYGSFQDINTRKLAELNQLKLNEEKSKILESIGDAFYALDGELNFTYMNSSCANLLAVKKEKIIGKNLFAEFPDLKNTLFEDELRKVQHTTEAAKFEFYYAPYDAWFEESIYPTPTGISVYFVDITQRKIANAEIAKSEEKRMLIMNGALDAIISIDTSESITFWNAQAEVIFGWKAEEVMGKPLSDMIIPEPFRKYHVEGLKNYLKTGEGKALNVLLELSAIRRNGEEFPIELTVIPIKQGGEEFFCAFIRDITQRKNSERKLIENENYLRTILDNEPECVKILNNKGELLSMNPAGLAMIEADNEQQVLGHRMTDLVNKDYQLGFNRLSKEVFKGNSGSFEFEITGLKGGCRWLETHAVPLKDTTGKIVNLLGVTRDITERKKAESELLNAFNERTSILERITEAFVSLDANWRYTYMNKQAGEIFNRDPEKIIGKHIWTEFPEGLNQPFHLAYEKAMATQEYIYLEEHYEPYDSWFENHIYPSPDGISIFFRDVTERKRSEKKLKMANERFEKVTEATNDVIWDWDMESDTFFRSNAIDNFFGVGTSKILEKKDFWNDNFHKDDIPKIKSSLQKAMDDPDCKRWEEKYRILNNNNEIFYVIDRGLILRNKNGKAIRMVGAMTNITEQKKQEGKLIELNQSLNEQALELKRSNEELEQFAFVASHDLQEPLRMITSFLDQLKRKYADRLDEKGQQYIYFATDGAKRMKQIILDLLLYSRANKPTEQSELINLNEIISEYNLLRRQVIAEKKATITFDGLPSIETYRAPITQIFHCLLDNALKYVDEYKSPCIEIGAIEKENVWQFSIKDNGVGIDPKFYDKIFIIFQRLQNRKEDDGTGIGLAITKRSVEFLGGEIWVDSEKDKGSTFYFTISKIKKLI